MSLSWPKQAIERLEMLKKWRELSRVVAKAARDILGDKLIAVYVVGSVAEDRATVFSDIDIALVVSDPKLKSIDMVIDVKLRAEDLELPLEAPIDIKILTEEEFKGALGKLYRRAPVELKSQH